MNFDDILAPLAAGDRVQVPPTWGQGRATFGGLVAALLYARAAAVLQDAGEDLAGKPPRSLTVSFVGPLAPGEARVETRVLRSGRNVTQVQALLWQVDERRPDAGEQVAAALLASFGTGRESQVVIAPAPAPSYPAPESLAPWPYIAGVTPEFMQHFGFCWTVGQLPFSGPPARTGDIGGWMRFRAPVARIGVAQLLGLIDAWPPAVLPMFPRPAPMSTLAWTVELTTAGLAALPALPGDAWLQYLAQTDFSGDGYAHTLSRTWAPDGTLLALCRQTVAVFA